jgi:hypothetical protein
MQRFFEFVVSHYVLASAFVGLVIAFIWVEIKRGGRTISPQHVKSNDK